jgi:hypothetical protein
MIAAVGLVPGGWLPRWLPGAWTASLSVSPGPAL